LKSATWGVSIAVSVYKIPDRLRVQPEPHIRTAIMRPRAANAANHSAAQQEMTR